MTNQAYLEKLKDPRWQKKRLEILQRDNWTCIHCKSTQDTLVVHHKYYLPDIEPWDYPNELLKTLCETCHQREQNRKYIEEYLISLLSNHLTAFHLEIINEGIGNLNKELSPIEYYQISEIISLLFEDDNFRNKILKNCFSDKTTNEDWFKTYKHNLKVFDKKWL